jgi:plastocyanin
MPAMANSNMMRPNTNPGMALMSSFSGFRSPSYGMMSSANGMMPYSGMYPMQSYSSPMMSYSSGGGGYGGGGYGGGGYGGDMQNSSYGTQESGVRGPSTELSSEEKSLSRVLTMSGVPNYGGRLLWPVGLRIVRGGATDDLRAQIDALFQAAAEHNQTGPANPNVARDLGRSLDALSKFLRRDREERFSLPLAVYEDSENFLAKLNHAQKLLEAGLEPQGGKVQLKAQQGGSEVGLYDNRFDPPILTVPAGTTVRWINHGEHKHTITSDSGDWGSKELGAESFYFYTFSRPGTYTYHCEVHPAEMRGTIVVK